MGVHSFVPALLHIFFMVYSLQRGCVSSVWWAGKVLLFDGNVLLYEFFGPEFHRLSVHQLEGGLGELLTFLLHFKEVLGAKEVRVRAAAGQLTSPKPHILCLTVLSCRWCLTAPPSLPRRWASCLPRCVCAGSQQSVCRLRPLPLLST